jgi:hypothetical protein
MVGNDVSEGCLSRPGRAVEDQRCEPVGKEHSPEQFPWPEEMFLPNVFIERSRAHSRCKWASQKAVLIPHGIEEIH